MKKKILYICVVIFIALVGVALYLSKTLPVSHDYLSANGCNENMSNNTYTECTKNALEKIRVEKKQYYDRFQESMKNMNKNALGLDEESNKDFQDWYKNSDDYNRSRCLANKYYMVAGSAYEQNVTTCQIFETQRDIQLLKELYINKKYFKS